MKVKQTDYIALHWLANGGSTYMVGPLIYNFESDNLDIVFTNYTHSSTDPHKGPVHPSKWVIIEVITNCAA